MNRWPRALAALAFYFFFGCAEPTVELLDPHARDAGRSDAASDTLMDGGQREPVEIPGLLGLRIEPSSIEIIDDGVAPPEGATLQAVGMFASGERDVTAEVLWSLVDKRLGSAENGMVTGSSCTGRTQVLARAKGMEATAEATFSLDAILTAPGAPKNLEQRFPSDLSADVVGDVSALRVVYPSDETMFPLNLARVDHQWVAAAGLDAFELRFESELAKIRVYTNLNHHETRPELWSWLAKAHAGKSLSFSVRAMSSRTPSVVHRSAPRTLYYSDSAVLGALYYWSTGAQGIMRATISGNASKFFPTSGPSTTSCGACHTVSRDGRRMAVGYIGQTLRQVSIPEGTLQIPARPDAVGPAYGWGTYNPDATRLLYANKGKLSLLNAATGQMIGEVPMPKGMLATFPDWSPDGKWVALAVASPRAMDNKTVTGTSIMRMPVLAGDKFGAPKEILKSTAVDDTLYFPMFAPDSRTLAFVRTKGASKDNANAGIFLMPADGSGPPQALARLNARVGDAAALNIGNNMPTWAPSTTNRTYWLAFSSIRDYGNVLVAQQRDQIWGAAIDVKEIGSKNDPSFAAFWMPFQQPEENNHRALWTIDPAQQCPPGIEICDNLDNDCNGIVDDACCTPAPEACGNNRDDDCDGTIDDGCHCLENEACENGTDDDCDGLLDGDDEDCFIVL